MQRSIVTKLLLTFVLLLPFVVGTNVFAATESSEEQPQVICPVMGGKVNRDLFIDYQGQRIYFCCAACPEKFRENPEKYLEKMKESGQTPERLEDG